jgi:WD40 repeat protein
VFRIFYKHKGFTSPVALSPDGCTMLAARVDNTFRFLDVASGGELKTFTGHSERLTSAVFSPDGRTVLSGSVDKTIKLWDVASGREIRTFTGHSDIVNSVAFWRMVAPRCRKASTIQSSFWRNVEDNDVSFLVAFSPDGRSALSGSDDHTVKFCDVASGHLLRTFAADCLVRFLLDGRTALSACGDQPFKLWDIASGRKLKTFRRSADVDVLSSVAFSPYGRTALLGRSDTVKSWDLASRRKIWTFDGQFDLGNSVVLSPDGRTELSSGGGFSNSIRVWDTVAGTERARMVSFQDGSWLTITPEGFLDASSPATAAENFSVVRGRDFCPADRAYSVLYRPDLVRKKIAGDRDGKVKAAAAQLDLDKVCFGSNSEQDQQAKTDAGQKP